MLSRFSTIPLKLKEAVINEEKGQEMCLIHLLYPISFPGGRDAKEGSQMLRFSIRPS